jgi:hypothetical protein
MARHSIIKKVAYINTQFPSIGPDTTWRVDFYQDGKWVHSRDLPGKSKYYAEDVSENWDNGLIKLEDNK